MKCRLFFCICAVLVSGLLLSGRQVAAAGDIDFYWALLIDGDDGVEALEFTTIPVVSKQSSLQIYTNFRRKSYLYLYLLSSGRELVPLHPPDPGFYASGPLEGVLKIPAGDERFVITPPGGQERFYLLVSAQRLPRLEELTTTYLEDTTDLTKGAALFREIKLLIRQHSQLTQATEKGVPVTGTLQTRGFPKTSSFQGVHVTASDFYSKILRFEHD